MAFTYQDMTDFIAFIYDEGLYPKETPGFSLIRDNMMGASEEFGARGDLPEEAMANLMESFPWTISQARQTAGYDDPFPSNPRPEGAMLPPYGWHENISAKDVVEFFAGDSMSAAEKALLIDTMNASGATSPIYFTGAIVLTQVAGGEVTAESVVNFAVSKNLVSPSYSQVLEVVENASDFTIGLYLAAFNRAGEHDGVAYWKSALNDKLADGLSQADALKALAGDMYYAGWINNEGGTNIADTRAYVEFVYENVLGRAPDAGGWDYWVSEIDSGAAPREKFLADFLYSALQAQGDSEYLSARIEVAQHVAQATVSGPGKWVDLANVLSGVRDAASAQARIQAIDRGDFGEPLGSAMLALSASVVSSASDIDLMFAQGYFDDGNPDLADTASDTAALDLALPGHLDLIGQSADDGLRPGYDASVG